MKTIPKLLKFSQHQKLPVLLDNDATLSAVVLLMPAILLPIRRLLRATELLLDLQNKPAPTHTLLVAGIWAPVLMSLGTL
jgi:hypothetical protein